MLRKLSESITSKYTPATGVAGKFLHISVLDHIVMTSETYYSFADEGLFVSCFV